MLECKSIDSLMNVNTKLLPKEGFLRCWKVQKISENIEFPDSDRTRYHIHSQHNESVFISTEDYPLGDSTENFEILKKAPWRGLHYSDHGHTRVIGFSDTDCVTPRFRNTYLVTYSDFSIVFFDLLPIFVSHYKLFM